MIELTAINFSSYPQILKMHVVRYIIVSVCSTAFISDLENYHVKQQDTMSDT